MTAIAQNLWSLDYDIKPGGLVLNDVRHDGFSMARDFRVTRVWVGMGGFGAKDYVLNGAAMPAQGGVTVLNGAGSGSASAFPFNVYRTMFGLSANFKTATPYLKGTPNACDVTIGQRYLFGDYGKNPPHEPGAVLEATRLFPLLDFSFPAVADPSKEYPAYFRADYRIDVALDNIGELQFMTYQYRPRNTDVNMNKAAIFRDNENIGISWPGIEKIFAAFEKPLKYEVSTWGLVEVPTYFYKDRTWDNLHVWPALRGTANNPVATPGAFHALHCHWRWGAVSGKTPGFAAKRVLPAAGSEQFKGLGWTDSAGGPLIDPRIPKQNLRFAVTRNDPDWAADKNPSEDDFTYMFQGKRRPDNIEKGDDLVAWFSFEVYRDPDKLSQPWEGTLFINGFYFGHNQETPPLAVTAGGGREEGANPSPERKWERPSKYR